MLMGDVAIKAINYIGHTMNIRTIAEFVEDEETLQAVREVGIYYAQGYAIARPAPIEIALFRDPVDAASTGTAEPVLLKTATASS